MKAAATHRTISEVVNDAVRDALSDDAADLGAFALLNDEAVIAAKPDVVLVMDNAGDQSTSDDALLANPGIAQTPAGQNAAVIRMDGSYLLGFGPRTPAALTDLVHQLYPDAKG